MPDISFDTGVKTYTLNGVCEVSFNPTDSTFAQSVYDAFDKLDRKQDEYKAEAQKSEGTPEMFDFLRKIDSEMRELIDGVFNVPVCEKLFGGMNVYSLADGLPVWCNFMLAIIDELDSAVEAEKAASRGRIEKYTKKYHR